MDISYTVQRSSRRKRLTITVERDGAVIVHAPSGTSEDRIREIVESKRQWIYEKVRHPQKYATLHPPGKELVNGESVLFLGKAYQLEILDSKSSAINLGKCLVIPKQLEDKRTSLKQWYIQQANERILPRIDSFAEELGVDYATTRIVDNRYRWGSCTPANNLNFNWRLIKAPMHVIDYVVVHELAHLLEGNHTPRFWNIVRARSPNMEKAKTWLKENGQLLEEEI